MQFVGLLIFIASAVFWFRHASRGARDVADAANTLANIPRRNRFRKKASKRGLELINDPLEAATVLMVCVARISDYARGHDGLLSEQAEARMIRNLKTYMQLSTREAEDLLTQMRWMVKDVLQADAALAPMTNVLSAKIRRTDADDLSDMLRKVSHADGAPNDAQRQFIFKVRERLGLGR